MGKTEIEKEYYLASFGSIAVSKMEDHQFRLIKGTTALRNKSIVYLKILSGNKQSAVGLVVCLFVCFNVDILKTFFFPFFSWIALLLANKKILLSVEYNGLHLLCPPVNTQQSDNLLKDSKLFDFIQKESVMICWFPSKAYKAS